MQATSAYSAHCRARQGQLFFIQDIGDRRRDRAMQRRERAGRERLYKTEGSKRREDKERAGKGKRKTEGKLGREEKREKG
jgi:hypothetical protein